MSNLSPGLVAFKLSFQNCPVILNGGVASFIPGGMLPLISITQAVDFAFGLLGGGVDTDLDDFFSAFEPLPGARLISQEFGKYPFANQQTAANSVIGKPLNVSLIMFAPARGSGGYATKLATMTALVATLKQHNAAGGTYTVATPSYFYTDCLLREMFDVTPAASKQVQMAWQFDFEQPLLSLSAAAAAQNSLMSKITAGTQINGQPTWSGLNPSVGLPPSLMTPNVAPAAANLPGSSVAEPAFTTGAP